MSFNLPRAILFGYKPTKLDRMIGWRSDHKHTEFQFSTRYRGISFSCTMADGVGGCRFKMIKYSHPEYWDIVYVPVTTEQEKLMWMQACKMTAYWALFATKPMDGRDTMPSANHCYYNAAHVKYDRGGAAFSYWTKWDVYKPSKKKRVCCRAVAEVVLAGYADAMHINRPVQATFFTVKGGLYQADFASMTPSEIDAMLRNYFSKKGM